LFQTSGFTLIELMIAMVVASIGILAVSGIIIFNQNSWNEGNAKLKLQRDTYYAVLRIEHKLKPATFTAVSVSDDNSTLVIGGDQFYVDESNDLVHKSGGNKELVVEGDEGTDFKVIPEGNTIKLTLTLKRGNLESSITTSVKPRN